jgi:hypothetical protein
MAGFEPRKHMTSPTFRVDFEDIFMLVKSDAESNHSRVVFLVINPIS